MFARTPLSRLLALLLCDGRRLYSVIRRSGAGSAVSRIASWHTYRVPGPAVGGYSMTLSDVWGLPEMPPAPKDFGPHFDFPPESLNGPPLHDPYPN